MADKKKSHVLWLTNLPAPYRFPIWDRMAESVELMVVFTLKRTNWRNWPEPGIKMWNYSYLSLNSLQIKEHDFIPSFRGSRKILRNIDVVIVGGWENFVYIRTILLAKKNKIPVVQFYESTSSSQRFHKGIIAKIRKWIFQEPDMFVTISKESKTALIEMGVSPEKIQVIFNPVDVSWFSSFAKKHRKQQVAGHRFLYVGQLIDRKNVATVIQAFKAIKNENDTFTIAGEGSLELGLKMLSRSLGIEESVNFVGHKRKEELGMLYASSNTLILASTNEVWGLVVNEALASGLNVIVSNRCGVAEFVNGMKGVFVCNTTNESISNTMIRSRQHWKNPINVPEILKFTPELFADEIVTIVSNLSMNN